MRNSSLKKGLLSSAALCGAIFNGGVALAQTAPAAQPEAAAQAGEEDGGLILVTAERRVGNLQSAPLAVSVRDEATLTAEGRTSSLQRILQDVPGVNYRENTGPAARNDTGSTGVTIRGIGANGALVGNVLSLVPAVALYVDDVINGIGGGYDLERVEILRGPQGTLYGRSATSGVVAIHTRQPTLGEFGFNGSAEVGNYDLYRFSAGLNVPIGEQVAVRVSGQHVEQDGYFSTSTGRLSTDEGRVRVLLQPTEALTINLGAAFQERTFGNGGSTPQTIATGPDFSVVAPIGQGTDQNQQYWANIDLDLGFATLTYVPTLREYEKSENIIGAFGAAFIGAGNEITHDRFVTHEARLASNNDSALTWQTGIFQYDNDIVATYAQRLLLGPNLLPGPALKAGNIDKSTSNTGVFAEGTYSLSDSTRVTAGIRYDHTSVRIDESACSDVPVPSCASLGGNAGRRQWNNTTFKARIDHDLSPGHLVYGSVSSAFIPGDVSIVTGVGGLVVAPYEAQTLTSYEIGSKNRFLDGRLTVNGAAFYYEYDGFQQGIELGSFGFPPIGLVGVGNSQARVLGAELEMNYRPTPADTFDFNLGYVDAYFVNKPALFAASVSQHDIPRTIPFQATAAYAHEFDLGSAGSLRLKAEGTYHSAYDTAVMTAAQAANPVIPILQRQDSVVIGNLFATWDTGSGFTISGYVRNLFDELYKNRTDTAGNSERLNTEFAEPRTFGVVVSADF